MRSSGPWNILLLLVISPVSAVADSDWIDTCAEPIQSFLDNKFADRNAGMVIGVVDEQGSRVFSAGRLDNGTDRLIDGETIFPLGSVTKVFTSLLLVDAAQRGEMGLDDPVTKHLPGDWKVPDFEGRPITLGHLARQDSGLPFHPDTIGDIRNPQTGELDLPRLKAAADAFTIEDLSRSVARHQLTTRPGESFQYSNVGMALLGHALEHRTGESFESLVVDRICRPLDMPDTAAILSDAQQQRLVRGHFPDGTGVGHWEFQAMVPAGGFFSTANDMLNFLRAELGISDTILTPSMKQTHLVQHSQSANFGRTAMPWHDSGVYNPPGSHLLGHAGHGYGGLAFVGIDTKNRRGVVVLTNRLKIHPNSIGWTLLQEMPFSAQNLVYAVREVEGVGIWLRAEPASGMARILIVFPESPAGRAGLTTKLLVRSINGESVADKSGQDYLKLLDGPVGTTVTLELFDPASSQTTETELTRDKFLTVVRK